jgi:PIN domain nuclease of toxin-antitoxin system
MGGFAALRLLLDTHIWLWSLLEPANLSARVAVELENPSNELWLSPVSTWELLILTEKGRIVLDRNPGDWIRKVFSEIPFREAPLTHQVAMASRSVTLSHQDPADRFIAATAMVYDLTLVTADERLVHSKEIAVLANR